MSLSWFVTASEAIIKGQRRTTDNSYRNTCSCIYVKAQDLAGASGLNCTANGAIALRRSAVGHENPFPRRRLDARCPFCYATFAGARGNRRDAPIPAVRLMTTSRLKSTQFGRSFTASSLATHAPVGVVAQDRG